MGFRPAVQSLSRAELRARVERAVVSSAFPHFGEEDCLRGCRTEDTTDPV